MDNNYHQLEVGETSADRRGSAGASSEKKATVHSHAGGTIFSSMMNVTNSTIGAGTLSIPFAIASCGLMFGFIVVVILGLVANFSIKLLLRSQQAQQAHSFSELASKAYGSRATQAVQVITFLQPFGVQCAFLIIMSRLGSSVIRTWAWDEFFLGDQKVFAVFVALCVLLPLSLFERMHSLRFTSTFALLCLISLLALVMGKAIDSDFGADDDSEGERTHIDMFIVNLRTLSAIPIVCYSFTSHVQIFPIYLDLQRRSIPRMMASVKSSIVVCGTIYLLVGGFGYATFGSKTNGDVLENFDDNGNIVVSLVKIALSITLMFHFPLMSVPSRMVLVGLCFPNSEVKRIHHIILTVGIVTTAFVVAMFVPNVENVFSLSGATCSAMVTYIFPPLFYLKLTPREEMSSLYYYSSLTMLVVGVIFILSSTAVIVAQFCGAIPS